jgi:hypothetical protein
MAMGVVKQPADLDGEPVGVGEAVQRPPHHGGETPSTLLEDDFEKKGLGGFRPAP